MPLRLIIYALATLALIGCSEKSSKHIEGPYYFETTKHSSFSFEPGGGLEFKLVHKKDGKTTLISNRPLALDVAFEWRVYGDNLVFIETGTSSIPRLVVFSERHGNTLLIEDMGLILWKIAADDKGVTCTYVDEHLKPTNNPAPKFYSADYLKGL